MFGRRQHQSVLTLLTAFEASTLARSRFLFGGGTRIVLDLDEFRESYDVDFLCSDAEGYADVRFAVATRGFTGLFTPSGLEQLSFPREMKIDQYGIRFLVEVGDDRLKVELIREARVDLDPGVRPEWSPVDCLSLSDCCAEKLLANSDRWADRQNLSRDLIDLSVLRRRTGALPATAWDKAEGAYRSAVRTDLRKALEAFLADPRHQENCFRGLRIDDPSSVLEGASLLLGEVG